MGKIYFFQMANISEYLLCVGTELTVMFMINIAFYNMQY